VAPGALYDGCLALDGVVVATPSALHAAPTLAALDGGLAVFCQKPLGRDAGECAAMVDAARAADRLLGVDLSYRHVAAFEAARGLVAAGAVGHVYLAELEFHNAYGPSTAWCRDRSQAGGGCVIDLGTHLVDLAAWVLGDLAVDAVTSRVYAQGRPLAAPIDAIEDCAVVRFDLAGGTTITLACSWFRHAGCDAVIGARFHGPDGAVAVANVDGSFFDFRTERRRGTAAEVVTEPPDRWGGRAAVRWAERVAAGAGFDPDVERVVDVARLVDRVYGR
ncbi:MAG: oxidoreductase, partial [Acidimicrobiales bacterium]|nr:oxidoreductase [Acidimicrobiales bacterium]